VFDSLLNTETIGSEAHSNEMQEQLQYVYPHCITNGEVKFSFNQPQIQTNNDDCGLFAIATATALAHQIDPMMISLDEKQLRSHLVACFESGRLAPFPVRQTCIGVDYLHDYNNDTKMVMVAQHQQQSLMSVVRADTETSPSSSDSEAESLITDVWTDTEVTETSSLSALHPPIWTAKQATEFSSNYPWLFFTNGFLGCKVCRDVKTLGAFQKHGIYLSKGWCSGTITCNGNTRQNQLSSLRKKIHEHEKGAAHKAADGIGHTASETIMENVLTEQQKHLYDSTTRIFRSVYACMKNNRPFTDLPILVNLQRINGLDMGKILHSRQSASEISTFISVKMKQKLCKEIIKSGAKIALILDESTTIADSSVLILYLRSSVYGKVTSFFIDLIELSGCDSTSITKAITSTLLIHGFDNDYLSNHLIGVCSDGASVMVGKNSGVLTEMVKKFPNIVMWHCLCHRIELSVGDTMKDIPGTSHFKIFMEKLYSLYSMSPKNKREVKAAALELHVQFKKIGKMLSIRWVASSFRAVSAVYHNYAALYSHFCAASTDVSRDAKTKASFMGLATSLASEEFVMNLGLFMDALSELTTVSEALQRDDVTLPRAYQVINRTIRALEKMKDDSTQYIKESIDGVTSLTYRTVHLTASGSSGRKQGSVDRKQFLQGLADNLKSRMFTTVASNRPTKSNSQCEEKLNEFTSLMSQVYRNSYIIVFNYTLFLLSQAAKHRFIKTLPSLNRQMHLNWYAIIVIMFIMSRIVFF